MDIKQIEQKIRSRCVAGENGCLIWTGSSAKGYGTVYVPPRKTLLVHRAMYTACVGAIPSGMYVCHKCDNPICCNPDHLWLGTARDNWRDMIAKGRHYLKSRLVCKHGHALTPDNVRINKSTGHRTCIECNRRLAREYSRKKLSTLKALSSGQRPPL